MRWTALQLLVVAAAVATSAAILFGRGLPPRSHVLRATTDNGLGCAELERSLAWGISPDTCQGRCPGLLINYAILEKNERAVDLLIAAGTSLDSCPADVAGPPLVFAMRYGTRDMVRRMLAAGADPNVRQNSNGRTALGEAIHMHQYGGGSGGYEFVQMLLEAGADPNLADARGNTPLGLARNNKPLTEMLLKYGAVEPKATTSDAPARP